MVNWNTTPLTTTFVSFAKLTALIPASNLAVPTTAQMSVTNPSGGGSSSALTFTVTASPILTLAVGTPTRSTSNVITIPITLGNAGSATANTVQITSSVLSVFATTTPLPIALGDLAVGDTTSTSLSYPGSAGTKGQTVAMKVKGTYIPSGASKLSTYSLNVKVKLP